uniref:Uncharacterized protein n=1 Tax=Arundo donax TaxID=35708 RepID=A0A0A9E1K5_ARUDO
MSKGEANRDTALTEYEKMRDSIVRQNNEVLQSLNLESILDSLRPQGPSSSKPSSKVPKTSHGKTREKPIGRPNLRTTIMNNKHTR